MSRSIDPNPLAALRDELHGSLVLPGEADYDTARAAWNLAVDQHPAAIAVPSDIDDVQTIVRAARSSGLGVTTQPNGHGADGALDGVILIRPSRFDEVSINADERSARIGAGVNWGRVLGMLDGSGLLALAGSNPEVNVVGLALNGGHSMFSRRYGLTATSIRAIELIDGTGEFVRVTDESDADLMWALRGGGGSFGVVTAIELELFPGESLYGGSLAFPADVAAEIIATAFEIAASAPDIGIDVGMARFPDMPMLPEPLRGKTLATVALVHIGDEASGAALVQPLLSTAAPIANSLTPFTIGSLAAVAAEPVDPMPIFDYGSTLDGFDRTSAHEFVEAFLAAADAGLMRAGIRILGGAIAKPAAPERAVIGAVSAPALLSASAVAFDPSLDGSAALKPLRELCDRRPAAGTVPSFLGYGATLADAYDPQTIARLSAVKKRVDPHAIIHSNRPL